MHKMNKERPILFSTPMVQAILDGRKTQTRRLCPTKWNNYPSDLWDPDRNKTDLWCLWGKRDTPNADKMVLPAARCPYGEPGDHLWVRESFFTVFNKGSANGHDKHVYYKATATHPDVPKTGWKPSIHMPRWASRITLKILDVRVERLHEITDEEAVREGIHFVYPANELTASQIHPRYCFKFLWHLIHKPAGLAGWEANPWVWVISFRRVSQ